jgi:hypothetical protein
MRKAKEIEITSLKAEKSNTSRAGVELVNPKDC